MKKPHKSQPHKHYRDEDAVGDRKPRQRVRAIIQDRDVKQIERALRRKDYNMLSEDLY